MAEAKWDVVVVGGGPAGMMAAREAAKNGSTVLLVEQNGILGKKLRITGKGRCNVTSDCTAEEFFGNVIRGGRFLTGAIHRFSPADTVAYFEGLGVPLKTERGRRVFPVSDKAADIADAMIRDVKAQGVTVETGRVTGLLSEETDGERRIAGVRLGPKEIRAGAVVLATGGVSYPGTGSRGDGHRMARDAGVPVTPLRPSLVPLITKEDTSELMGLTLKNVTLTLSAPDGKVLYSEMGEMLFTHFGVSGPLVLSASTHIPGDPAGYRLTVDLKPALDDKTLDARILSDFALFAGKDFCNALGKLLPSSLIPYVIRQTGLDPHGKISQMTREGRQKLLRTLKALPLTVTGFRPIDEAIVTAGGVDTAAVHPKTMMAKSLPGLFFAGELLDADAYTGGFNLQIAFATGRAAGLGASAYAAGRDD